MWGQQWGTPVVPGTQSAWLKPNIPKYVPPNYKGNIIQLTQLNPHRMPSPPTFQERKYGSQQRYHRNGSLRFEVTAQILIDKKWVYAQGVSTKKKEAARMAAKALYEKLLAYNPPLARKAPAPAGAKTKDGKNAKNKTGSNILMINLRYINNKLGVGFDYQRRGWLITALEDDPGQPSLLKGDVLTALNGVSLADKSMEEQLEIFKAQLRHGATASVQRGAHVLRRYNRENGISAKKPLASAHMSPMALLQRFHQRNRKVCPNKPELLLVGSAGPPHNRIFIFEAKLQYNGLLQTSRASDVSKKKAQNRAADMLVQQLERLGVDMNQMTTKPQKGPSKKQTSGLTTIFPAPTPMLPPKDGSSSCPLEIGIPVEALYGKERKWFQGGICMGASTKEPGKINVFWAHWNNYSDHPPDEVRPMSHGEKLRVTPSGTSVPVKSAHTGPMELLFAMFQKLDTSAKRDDYYSAESGWDVSKLQGDINILSGKAQGTVVL